MYLNNNSLMPIVSISLTDEILKEIDKLQKTMGFSGRSDAIRASIRSFVSEEKQKAELFDYDNEVTEIKHSYEDLITTHLHSKIDGEKCMELFMLNGNAEKVSTVTKKFQINKKMDTIKLVAL